MAEGDIRSDHATTAGILGVLVLLCGIGDFITGIIWIARFHIPGGAGVWSGIPLIVTGILGIILWKKKNRGVAIGFLVMCIICIILAAVQAFRAWLGYVLWVYLSGDAKCNEVGKNCVCINREGKTETLTGNHCDIVNTVVGGLLALIILSAFGAFFSFIGSIFGCISTCGSRQTPGAVVVQQPGIVTMTTTQHGYIGPQGYPPKAGYPQQQMQGGYPQQPQQVGYPQYPPQAGYPQYPPQAAGGYPQQQMEAPPQYSEKHSTAS